MWLLKFLPDWIFYGLLFIGLIGYVVTYLLRFVPIPALYIYKTPIQIVSVVLIVIGTFMSGAIHDNAAWQARVDELEKKLAEAATQSAQQNEKIVEKIVYKNQIVKQRGEEIIKYVDREIVKYDNQCVIPKEFIEAHNKAARGVK